jgi:hypothetical protein
LENKNQFQPETMGESSTKGKELSQISTNLEEIITEREKQLTV